MSFFKLGGKKTTTTTTTTTTTVTKTTTTTIGGEVKAPKSNPGRFPFSLPRKPVSNGLPASDNKKFIGTMISSVPFGQGKK